MSSEQFAELGSVQLLAFSARACSLSFLSLGVAFLEIFRAVLIYLVLFSGLFLGLSLFSDSVDFSYSKGSFFLILLRSFSWVFFYRAFLSGSVLFSTALSSEQACHQFLCR